ncbi:hypothetical protein V9T40_007270 [Parthenolecanium corni]|uniref:Uncharacterized protein n=1 Tax=Parthenolecanium corni TaxID=536013 RepID=A0AAN9TX54_9HEMI
MVMSNDTILDLIPLSTNVRMVLKKDSLGIAVTQGDKRLRKIRLKFADTNSYASILIARSCAAMLKKYVQVEDLSYKDVFAPSGSSNEDENLSVSLQEHTSKLMDMNLSELSAGKYLRSAVTKKLVVIRNCDKDFTSLYPLEDMIEMCILDKDFPSFVAEVHETLLKKLKRN